MLFVGLARQIPGTGNESSARRLQWDYPEGGAKVIAEYWLETSDPAVITVVEADHVGQIMMISSAWTDLFEISVFPAVTAEEGLEMLKMLNPE
jgi:hypothetical protein